jgi:hypothetical protein
MHSFDQKISEITVPGVIRLIRELAVVGVLAYLCVKLFSGDLSLDFGKLSPTELVSFLLAFFSIGLSAAFYFAATSQSNQFYDNVNKFSKDTSELLGRLDEQVKGIGGRQSELKDSFDKYYLKDRPKQNEAAKEEVQAKTKEVEENLSKMVSELLDKTNLSQTERAAFEAELKSRDAELSALRERMGRLSTANEASVRRYAQRMIERIGVEKAINLSIDDLAIEVTKIGVAPFRRDLMRLGFITTEKPASSVDITDTGRKLFLAALEQAIEQHKDA